MGLRRRLLWAKVITAYTFYACPFIYAPSLQNKYPNIANIGFLRILLDEVLSPPEVSQAQHNTGPQMPIFCVE